MNSRMQQGEEMIERDGPKEWKKKKTTENEPLKETKSGGDNKFKDQRWV